MQLLDDEGRLLGVLNVVDALVVLIVVAILITGFALATGDEPNTKSATTYVTLDLGSHSTNLAERIAEGDTYAPNDQDRLTITDVYLAPHDDRVTVIVRARLAGSAVEEPPETAMESVHYEEGFPWLGRNLSIKTSEYNVTGTIQAVGGNSELNLETRQVLISDIVDASDVDAISTGDIHEIAGRTVGTVESVQVYSTGNPARMRVFVGLSLKTIELGERSRFGTRFVRKGVTIPFRTEAYTLDGRIERVDATEELGTAMNRHVTLRMQNVPPMRANLIEAGMADIAGGEKIAEIVDVDSEPSKVVTTSDEGEIFVRDHPLNQDLVLTANLSVRETLNGIRFKGETIQRGSKITLAFGDTTIRATVVGL